MIKLFRRYGARILAYDALCFMMLISPKKTSFPFKKIVVIIFTLWPSGLNLIAQIQCIGQYLA